MKKGIGCLLVVVVLIAAGMFLVRFITGAFPGSSDDSESGKESSGYTQIYFDDLTNDLTNDIGSAKSQYLDKKVIIVGDFDKMNLDGESKIEGFSEDCIVISGGENISDTVLVVGRMQTDDQREKFKEFSEGDTVVLQGTITDISETTVFMDVNNME